MRLPDKPIVRLSARGAGPLNRDCEGLSRHVPAHVVDGQTGRASLACERHSPPHNNPNARMARADIGLPLRSLESLTEEAMTAMAAIALHAALNVSA